jgi:simple sugar transport system ATP-binding protein
VGPLDFEVPARRVVGLAGLLGSGRTETARLLFGVDRADAGTISVDGQTRSVRSPRQAIRCGFAFTSEDRKLSGIVPELSVTENITLALQARRNWLRRISATAAQAVAERFIAALRIKTPHAGEAMRNLSGGNQQKALLARWLAVEPRLLILDEPTRGIDVGAKADIEALTAELCADGMSVLFISSELEEVVRVSHHLVILRDRHKVGELHGEQIDLSQVIHRIAEPHHE